MWQTDWAEDAGQNTSGTPQSTSALAPADVESVYLLHWSEHCVECTVPDCYKVCPLYVQRRDLKCARFKNGIVPNPRYPGLFPFGAEIEFRRWGKLESTFGFGALKPGQARLLDRADRVLVKGVRFVSSGLRRFSPYYRLNGAYAVFREFLLRTMTRNRREVFDEFVVEAWNVRPEPMRLVIECWQEEPRFRTSILVEPGRTLHRIPAASMNVDLYGSRGLVRVYPDNDAEAHVVFSWLDFVRYAGTRGRAALNPMQPSAQTSNPASKVKCVIWDLDQTVWDGILGEQDPEKVSLRPEVLETMLALDEKGTVQSIASKNDHDDAWGVLQRLGVAHLFLYPAINWEPKSANIRRIADELNIGVDACAFVDDSPFERAEVSHQLPAIRTYSDLDVPKLLERPEFDVPVTEESRQRRLFYMVDSERKHVAREYGDDYEAFLQSCNMEAKLFTPAERAHVERCLELLHRSNQLNLSTHRYTPEEFERLLADRDALCVCTACQDRFGDYGVVGFASVRRYRDRLFLVDFVLSCRVAQKQVENTWFQWLRSVAKAAGYAKVEARYVKTSRNGVLLNALKEAGFQEIQMDDEGSLIELDCNLTPTAAGPVSIIAAVAELPR